MDEFLFKSLAVLAFLVIAIVSLVILLASLGKTLGIRKLYISVLLRIFEVNLLKRTYFRASNFGNYITFARSVTLEKCMGLKNNGK